MPIFIPRTHFWLIFPPLTNTEHFQFIFPLNLVLLFPSMDPELFILHDTKVYDDPVLSVKSVMTIMLKCLWQTRYFWCQLLSAKFYLLYSQIWHNFVIPHHSFLFSLPFIGLYSSLVLGGRGRGVGI